MYLYISQRGNTHAKVEKNVFLKYFLHIYWYTFPYSFLKTDSQFLFIFLFYWQLVSVLTVEKQDVNVSHYYFVHLILEC